jgi:amino acid transporter
MKKNYTVLLILLFFASIAGGMALKKIFDYSMIIGVGLAMLFLLTAAFSLKGAFVKNGFAAANSSFCLFNYRGKLVQ